MTAPKKKTTDKNLCAICGKAEYVKVALAGPGENIIYNMFGFKGPQPHKIELWRCPKCGNVAWFYDPPGADEG